MNRLLLLDSVGFDSRRRGNRLNELKNLIVLYAPLFEVIFHESDERAEPLALELGKLSGIKEIIADERIDTETMTAPGPAAEWVTSVSAGYNGGVVAVIFAPVVRLLAQTSLGRAIQEIEFGDSPLILADLSTHVMYAPLMSTKQLR